MRGWTQGSGRDLHDVAAELADAGVDALIVTQIARDGTLEGPDVDGLSALLGETAIPLVASGGVGTLDHLRTLAGVVGRPERPRARTWRGHRGLRVRPTLSPSPAFNYAAVAG